MASWFVNRLSILTVHGCGYYVDRWRRQLAYRVVRRVAIKIVAVTDEIGNFLRNRVGVWSDRLMTFYNGIDAKWFGPGRSGNPPGLGYVCFSVVVQRFAAFVAENDGRIEARGCDQQKMDLFGKVAISEFMNNC